MTETEASATSEVHAGGSAPRGGKRGMRTFRLADAPMLHETAMMSMPTMEPDASEQMVEWATSGGQIVKVLFGDPQGSGMSLVWSWFGPGFTLPRHSHSGDCLYFVHRGAVHMGNTVISAGDGFFLPASAPYAYSAGPEGVEVLEFLEFRRVCSFDMRITESLARWDQILDVSRANKERWTTDADAYC
jgi:hypothetical protein